MPRHAENRVISGRVDAHRRIEENKTEPSGIHSREYSHDYKRVRVALRAANSRGGDSLAKFMIELSDVEPEVAGRDALAVVLNQKLPVHTLR